MAGMHVDIDDDAARSHPRWAEYVDETIHEHGTAELATPDDFVLWLFHATATEGGA